MTRRRIIVTGLGMALVLFDASRTRDIHATTSVASGNGDGMDTRLFRAAVDSKGFFSVNGTDVLGKGDFAFGMVLDYGHALLRLRDETSGGVPRAETRLIDSQLHAVIFAGYSPFKNLTVGIGIPTDLVAGNAQAVGTAAPGTTPGVKTDVNSFFGGSFQLNVKYRLLRVEDQPIGMAVIAQVELPASEEARLGYAAGSGPSVTPILALEKRFGAAQRFRVGVNFGATFTGGTGTAIGDLAKGDPGQSLQHGNLARAALGMSYRVSDAVDLVGETYGSQLFKNDAGGSAGTSAEVVGGLKVFVERNSYLFLGGGVGTLKGYQAADQRAFLGFVFEPSIGDRDGDGLKDDVDKCPDAPEDRDGFEDEDGCPDPDNDKDHFLDRDDACPNEPETQNGIADGDGCPDGLDGDRDHDKRKDSIDKCPDEPEDVDGFQDADGCPDPDNDIDHILDKDDACPDVKENVNGFEDGDGCPDTPIIIEGPDLLLIQKIQFDYDSAKIKTGSLPIIDAMAKLLADHDEFTLVEVHGHADERGDDLYNLKLTQLRVDSVMAALVSRGVAPSRLRAKGYGEYCPVDPEHTDKAWEENRRVEFTVIKTKGGPTGAVLGCDNAKKHGVKPDAVP
jgi:OmpA-OmpF porin, OOP family